MISGKNLENRTSPPFRKKKFWEFFQDIYKEIEYNGGIHKLGNR